MAAKSGKLVLLKLGTGVSATPIMSARTNSMTINHSQVDVTTKGDNGWGAILAGGGTTEMTVSLEGVFLNDTDDKTIEGYAVAGSSNEYTLVTSNGAKFEGEFIVSSITIGGTYNEAQTYSISLRNNGEIVYTAGV